MAVYTEFSEGNFNRSGNGSAAMCACAYKDGILIKTDIPNEKIKAARKESISTSFDVRDTEYDTVKIYLWGSLENMISICGGYESD